MTAILSSPLVPAGLILVSFVLIVTGTACAAWYWAE
jgi:hypothetical protein